MCVKISKNELKEFLSFSNEECGVVEINLAREKKKKENKILRVRRSHDDDKKNIQPRLLKRCVVVRGRDDVV